MTVGIVTVSMLYLFCHQVVKVDSGKEDMSLDLLIVISTSTKPSERCNSTHVQHVLKHQLLYIVTLY